MPPTDYPSLQPALHMQIKIGGAFPVGSLSRGTPLTVVPIVGGQVRSEEGFFFNTDSNNDNSVLPAGGGGGGGGETRLDAVLKGVGNDYVRNDPDGRRMRLDSAVICE